VSKILYAKIEVAKIRKIGCKTVLLSRVFMEDEQQKLREGLFLWYFSVTWKADPLPGYG
jgi:hypothetical protein